MQQSELIFTEKETKERTENWIKTRWQRIRENGAWLEREQGRLTILKKMYNIRIWINTKYTSKKLTEVNASNSEVFKIGILDISLGSALLVIKFQKSLLLVYAESINN